MFKKILFQIHWFIGITAGTLLMLVGITGATLSFRDEIIELLNPGIMNVARQATPTLNLQQLTARIQEAHPENSIATLTLTADAADASRVNTVKVGFAPPPGERRGLSRYVDPYSAALLPTPAAEGVLKWIERLHRFLLLEPNDGGKLLMGSTSMCLLFLALSGLYLRWPRYAASWRAWLRLDFSLKGRPFLWHIHSVLGTWALTMYLVFTITGMYWSFDWVKHGIDGMLGSAPVEKTARPPQADKADKTGSPQTGERMAARERTQGGERTREGGEQKAKSQRPVLQPEQLERIWGAFTAAVPGYDSVTLRLPERAGQAVQVNYLAKNAPHERARNRLRIDVDSGQVSEHQRYADKDMGGRLLDSIYPLHMGTYFGLPGRILWMIAALALPLFGITGWMLYLDRRRKKRGIARQRAGLAGSAGTLPGASANDKILIVFASQSGNAEQLALRTAKALNTAGAATIVLSIAQLGMEQLRHNRQVLFIASTFGEGDPPDPARAFTRQLIHHSGATLSQLRYGILALGDRHYRNFCGYGQTLDHYLQSQGAHSQFAMIEVDNNDPHALLLWQHALSDFCEVAVTGLFDVATAAAATAAAATTATDSGAENIKALAAVPPYHPWRLAKRRHLNPGSAGEPIFHLELEALPETGITEPVRWVSGALVEIMPRHAPQRVAAFLQETGLQGETRVQWQGRDMTLADALSQAVLPEAAATAATSAAATATTPAAIAGNLKHLAPRRYSVASVMEDGAIHLLVRQATHEGGLGLGSGWLTAHAATGGEISMRLLENPSFALATPPAPAIFIGNGSGMAGLRAHLKARIGDGQHRNWLLFGERNRAVDFYYGEEILQWQQDGKLQRVDLAFSRDQSERIYVQDVLRLAHAELRTWLADGAVIYVCGSMDGMAAGVDTVLSDIIGEDALEQLIAAGRYRRDIY